MATCSAKPAGPHEHSYLLTRSMTRRDQRRADAFMRRYRQWKRNLEDWEVYINGAAQYWSGPRPRWPGPPPTPPTITNVACQVAADFGVSRIFNILKRELSQRFECTGSCRRGYVCKQKFSRKRGRGYSLTAKKTYCEFTLVGDCECVPGKPEIEA